MLQELSEELQRELNTSFISKLKNYGQFDFEGQTIVVESTQHLWFQVKIILVHQFHIHKSTSFYSIKESPNFAVFLKQINAYKVTHEEDAINIFFFVQLNQEKSLKKDTFISELQKLKTEKPHELRSMISTSLNKYQKHYLQVIHNMPFDNRIDDVFHNDQAIIFLGKGCLALHENEVLPHIIRQQKVLFNQQSCQQFIQLKETTDQIYSQLQKHNKKDEFVVDSIVNSIQAYKYFTFYQHKFLLLRYTVFLKVLEESSDNKKTYKIDDTVIQQSGLFAVKSDGDHQLISLEGDHQQIYPQIIHLLGKQLASIMDTTRFMNTFAETIVHENINSSKDVLELAYKFKLGSVLLYRSKFFTNQACVYLGSDLLITVILDNSNNYNKMNNVEDINQSDNVISDEQAQMRNGGNKEMEMEEQKQTNDGSNQIFQFSRLEEFIQGVKTIQEIRFTFQPYDKQELFEKALQMNHSSFQFNIYKQNSEHLAFELASGFRFSPQQKLFVNKLGEAIQNIFFSK